jgi:hypothetical protein
MRVAQGQIRTLMAGRPHNFARTAERQRRRQIATRYGSDAPDGETRHQEVEAGSSANIDLSTIVASTKPKPATIDEYLAGVNVNYRAAPPPEGFKACVSWMI